MNPGSNCWKEMEEDSSSSATPTALVKILEILTRESKRHPEELAKILAQDKQDLI